MGVMINNRLYIARGSKCKSRGNIRKMDTATKSTGGRGMGLTWGSASEKVNMNIRLCPKPNKGDLPQVAFPLGTNKG
jgi:hypothetical protein